MATRCRDRAPRDRNIEPLLKRMPVKYTPVTKFSTKLSPFYLGDLFVLQELCGGMSSQNRLSAGAPNWIWHSLCLASSVVMEKLASV